MAEEVLGKTVKLLRQERTSAKSSFTKLANFISRGANTMLKAELKEEFGKLSDRFRSVLDSNEDYRIGLEADVKAADNEAELDEQKETNINKTIKGTEIKMEEVRDIVQTNLWGRYGKNELRTSILEAEEAIDEANRVQVRSDNLEGYEVHLTLLEEKINAAISAMSEWERWIPESSKDELNGRLKELRAAHYRLKLRKAEFAISRRLADQGTSGKPVQLPPPVVKIKPTTLPIFQGSKREFHRWRKDWESLQGQGEPTGSPEVLKIQLLESVSEAIAKELRLSTYTTAADMFRVLDNRYGNKTTITVEILEGLDNMPPVKGNQPRKIIDLIQSVEKALADLTELGNVGAMKNPLVIKSIESKLPDFIKRDWIMFLVNPENNVTADTHFDMLLKFLKNQEEILETLEQLKIVDKPEKRYERKSASTRVTKKEVDEGCGVCGDRGHSNKVFFCKKFKALKLSEKKSVLKKLGACSKCLGYHDDDRYCREKFFMQEYRLQNGWNWSRPPLFPVPKN